MKENLKVGDRVRVFDEEKKSEHAATWVGPYNVMKVLPHGSYVVADDMGNELKRSIDKLKVIPHDDNDGADTFEVERIIRARPKRKWNTTGGVAEENLKRDGLSHPDHFQYLVKWKGYSNSMNEWLKHEDFVMGDMITRFWKEQAPERMTKRKQLSRVKRSAQPRAPKRKKRA